MCSKITQRKKMIGIYKKLVYGYDIDNPMKYIGQPRKHSAKKWIRINKAITKKCAEVSGKNTHILPFADGIIIINNIWRKKYNSKVKPAGRITALRMIEKTLFTCIGNKLIK